MTADQEDQELVMALLSADNDIDRAFIRLAKEKALNRPAP